MHWGRRFRRAIAVVMLSGGFVAVPTAAHAAGDNATYACTVRADFIGHPSTFANTPVWSWTLNGSGRCVSTAGPLAKVLTLSLVGTGACGAPSFTTSPRQPWSPIFAASTVRFPDGSSQGLYQVWLPTRLGRVMSVLIHERFPVPSRFVAVGGPSGVAVGVVTAQTGGPGAPVIHTQLAMVVHASELVPTPDEVNPC